MATSTRAVITQCNRVMRETFQDVMGAQGEQCGRLLRGGLNVDK